jgi:hypothetical protein
MENGRKTMDTMIDENSIIKINDAETDINGTHLQAHLDISYEELVDVLGEPEEGDGYKVHAEWHLENAEGTVATIYNWKTGPMVEHVRNWHIGGHDAKAISLVRSIFKGKTVTNW